MSKKYAYQESFTFEGKRYYVKANSKRELAEKVALKKNDLESGTKRLKASRITVKEWADLCFEQYKTNVAPITLESQKGKVKKWILPEIGNMRIKDVKQLHIQKIMNNMQGKAQDTIRKVYQLASFIFDKAIQNNIINENPCKYVTIPKGGKTIRRAITDIEYHYVLQVAEEDERFVFYLFMLFCGCRPSEVANLRGMDVKKINGMNILHIEGTKTKNAVRDVPIPDYLMERIPKTEPFDYIFTNNNGKPLTRGNRERLCRAFKRALNIAMGCKIYRNELIPPFPLAPDFVPYCLRHTYCTNLQKQNIDIRTAQYLMGHADISMTANIYTHMTEETLMDVATKLKSNGKKTVQNVETDVETKPQPIAITNFV